MLGHRRLCVQVNADVSVYGGVASELRYPIAIEVNHSIRGALTERTFGDHREGRGMSESTSDNQLRTFSYRDIDDKSSNGGSRESRPGGVDKPSADNVLCSNVRGEHAVLSFEADISYAMVQRRHWNFST